ncbi:hypothetical protein DFJ68_0580 [Terracoccus luteus]|uniref:Surface-anchored protein n=1 Tax=Terracoccus luteus TaxID=53356 RepID=A0A495XWF8_9MICO|nr:hypothetical protein [Terracoccus luteus]RKT77164.1 hypothetical protein DFJ68_0580 [Terracoccus luteus]
MPKRLYAALGTLGLTATAITASATTAAADAPCAITNFAPRSVTVGLSPVTSTFGISTTGCALTYWNAEDSGFLFYVYKGSPQNTFNPYDNADAGYHHVIVSASNSEYDTTEKTFTNGFTLKRNAGWNNTFNASPEPVTKGKPITIRGKLIIADWNNNRYVNYTNRTIQVQFRAGTSGPWTTVKSVVTGSDGWLSTTVTATQSGYWHVVWAGNSAAGANTSPADYVQVVS